MAESLDRLRPKLSGVQWSVRFGTIVLAVCALAWAWQDSGMSKSGLLWRNRGQAVDYILGQKMDASTIEDRRAQVERDIRGEVQARYRDEISASYRERGEPPPGFFDLSREAAARATAYFDELGEEALAAQVQARLEAENVVGGRRGGFFPPETSIRKIGGDPEDLDDLVPAVSWVVDLADRAGDPVRSIVRWSFTLVTGEGYMGVLFETIAIAIWGTLLAVVLAIPLSLFGATRSLQILAPGEHIVHRVLRWFGKFVVRRSFDVSRGFNEIVLALIFVAVLGLGPLPGVLALLIHTYGVLGKVFSEAIETIDQKQVEGVQSTGASATQVVAFSVMPQIMPYVVSQSLLRFESNVRGATILGVVGAGGIGQLLMDKFRAYQYQEVATMMIIIIVVVTLIDFLCGRVMKALV